MINWKTLIKKITSNKIKQVVVENEFKKLETFDLIYFRGKSHFEDDGNQNYFLFQTPYRYFKTVSNTDASVLSWKSKGLSDESIRSPSTCNNVLNPLLKYVCSKAKVTFHGDCLKQENISFDHGKVINVYFVYEIDRSVSTLI